MIKFLKCFLLCSMTIITGCGKETMIQSDLSSLAEEIMQFYDKTGTYPESLDDLDIDIPRDRLGTGPYKYINWDNEIVRVYSVGWDGRDDQSFKDMVYKIKDSRPVFELMQIATTKDDPDNGIALFMQAGKLFVEQISTPSQNANRSKFSPDPVAEFWMSIADKVQFVIVHGWDQAALQEKRPKLTSNFSDLDETFTKLKDVFDLFHQGANKDYSKPYSLPPRLDNPNPSFLTYLILGNS